jgi:hypothetical protein
MGWGSGRPLHRKGWGGEPFKSPDAVSRRGVQVYSGMLGAQGRTMVNAVPTMGQILAEFAPAYLAHVTPIESRFLADRHRDLEGQLGHIEDRNTRSIVAAMLLAGSTLGPFTKA